LYVSTHGTPAEYVCKHDEIVEEMGEPEIVPQRYETFIHPRSIGKRDASSYQPIRVVFNETFLLNDADSRQCTVVGQVCFNIFVFTLFRTIKEEIQQTIQYDVRVEMDIITVGELVSMKW
jgi:hypothetical protein